MGVEANPEFQRLAGLGELHLEVIRHRLERDFNLKCRVHKPRVSYKETIGRPAEVAALVAQAPRVTRVL